MTIGESIFSWLQTNLPTVVAEQNKLSQAALSGVRFWYIRRSSEAQLSLSGDDFGIREETFDMEVICENIATAMTTRQTIKDALHGFRGDLSGTTIQAMFVEDADDNYLPHNLDADAGAHVAALDMRIIYSV